MTFQTMEARRQRMTFKELKHKVFNPEFLSSKKKKKHLKKKKENKDFLER